MCLDLFANSSDYLGELAGLELARMGGRSPSGDDLTQAESLIAGLVAEGNPDDNRGARLILPDIRAHARLANRHGHSTVP